MTFELRANIKFCFKLGETFIERHQIVQKVYGDECLSRRTIYKRFKRFKEGREDLNDDKCSNRPKSAVNEENVKIVPEFIKKESKSSFQRAKRSML